MRQLLAFLDDLYERKIYYRLNHVSLKVRDSIMVEIAVPGQRWEVEFMDDGSIEIEKFISSGQIFVCKEIHQCKEIEELFSEFSD
ncbi:MAG: hypothetical protein LBS00_04450 [Synergistaceae bacterium]|nr:hypothetical protein [Synergistaceae bacterium]